MELPRETFFSSFNSHLNRTQPLPVSARLRRGVPEPTSCSGAERRSLPQMNKSLRLGMKGLCQWRRRGKAAIRLAAVRARGAPAVPQQRGLGGAPIFTTTGVVSGPVITEPFLVH